MVLNSLRKRGKLIRLIFLKRKVDLNLSFNFYTVKIRKRFTELFTNIK